MKKISNNIYSKRYGYFVVYIIRGKDGDILIDTGFTNMRRRLKKLLDNFNIKYIILTHAHIDHIWNASYLKKLYDSKIILCKKDVINIDNSNIDPMPVNKSYKYRTKLMKYGMDHFKPEKFDVDILIDKDMELELCGIKLKFILLPGHTNGSMGIMYKDILFAGDALVNRKWYVEPAYQNQNNKKALESIMKIIDLKPKTIYIGHEMPINYDKLLKSKDKIIAKCDIKNSD